MVTCTTPPFRAAVRLNSGVRLQERIVVKIFDKSEDAYIAWVAANQSGFVANVNRDSNVPQYPIAHKASHKTMWSTKTGNFTSGDYTKACSTSLEELEGYAKLKYRRTILYCGTCFRTKAAT